MDLTNYLSFQKEVLKLYKKNQINFLFRKNGISLDGEHFHDILIEKFAIKEVETYFNFFLMSLYSMTKKEDEKFIIKKLLDAAQTKKLENFNEETLKESLKYIKENFISESLENEYIYRTKTLSYFYNNSSYEINYKVLDRSKTFKVALIHLELFSNIKKEKDFTFELNKNSVNNLISKLNEIKKELENE